MRAIRLCLVLSVAILALIGCRATEVVDMDESSVRNLGVAQSGQQEVPFRMVVDNTFEVVPPPPPPFIHAVFRGTGQSDPFGPAEFFATSEINVFVVPNEQTVDGVFTYQNGDELHLNSVGFGLPDQLEDNIFGEWTITGGTGRFANATGYGTYVGTVFADAGSAHWTMDGVISGFGGPASGSKRDKGN